MANNSTNSTFDDYYFQIYVKVSFTSAGFLLLVAIGTIITNGIALVAIFKDPLHCFRNPMATFLTGILVSDFLTGLIVEPVLVSTYLIWMNDELNFKDYEKIIRSSQILSAVTINTSFLTVLALAVSQLLAMRWPSIYNRYITSGLAVCVIGCIWLYTIMFALLPEMANMSIEIYFLVDLVLHTTLISLAIAFVYILVYISFKRAMRRHEITEEAREDIENRPEIPKEKVEKEFLVVTFLVFLVLLVTVWPFTITFYILIIRVIQNYFTDSFLMLYIVFIFLNDILYLKFFFDPLIFVWRLSKYREATKLVLAPIKDKFCCCSGRVGSLPRAAYHRQEDEGSTENPLAPEWSTDVSGAFIKETEEGPAHA